MQSFLESDSERLIKSFTRRLAYLHDCGPAVEIVNDWLKPDGWIGKANCNFNPFGLEVFTNIAPVSPEKTLEAIDRAANGENGEVFASRQNPQYNEFVRLLRQLAYEPELFKSSAELICRFALSEDRNENRNSIRDVLKSLFYIQLSGTQAPMDMRAEIITELSESGDQDKQELAIVLLSSALETWHFSSSHDFTFGARPRDFGYYPETGEEVVRWFETFVGICTHLVLSGEPISQEAKRILCEHLRGLWTNAGIFDALEDSIKQIHQQQAWNEAWIAVREIIKYDSKGFEKEISERIQALERLLRPNDLLERARTFALSDENSAFTLEDDYETEEDPMSGWKKMQETTQEIAAQVVQDAELFNSLMPELVITHNSRIYSFGRGLAYGCDDKKKVWELLCVQFKNAPPEKRQFNLLTGFLSLCSESDRAFYDSALDSLIHEGVLGEWFPIFQMTSPIDHRGIERLHESLDTGKPRIQTFQYLAWGGNHEPISDDELADLLEKILSKEEGIGVVIEILKMRFFISKKESRNYSENLLTVAREALSEYSFPGGSKRHGGADFDLEQIANICLNGKEGVEATTQLCRHLSQAITENAIFVFDYPGLSSALARTQPMVFLEEIVGNSDIKDYQRRRMFVDGFERRSNPIDAISDNDLITWCDRDPESRYPLIASMIQPFSKGEKEDKPEWKRIVLSIFEKAPRLEAVLVYLSRSIRPSGWSGSLAAILEKRLVLFQSLYDHHNAEIRAWAKSQYSALQESIKQEREWEEARERKRNETFE
ncbi:MAG: hypothetical protein QY305_06830 [Candidatus Brocadiaceae baterium WH-1]|uniref:hypothetical protein n=1 Tax=Candidatus Loosdrechtia sp. TaxID=3101272 RepID=UPI003A7A19E4|nr:MAG: hypothetical protein QY305_06830 [Candidatus Jettenia sp. AMX2]